MRRNLRPLILLAVSLAGLLAAGWQLASGRAGAAAGRPVLESCCPPGAEPPATR